MIRDGLFSEDTGRIEDQFIMSGSSLERLKDKRSTKEKGFKLEKLVKEAERHIKGKYPRMIARLPRETGWA